MTTQTPTNLAPVTAHPRERNRLAGGAVLVILGVTLLIGPLTNWQVSWVALPMLALIFLVSALITRSLGLLIPGGILAGIALGTALGTPVLGADIGIGHSGSLFMLCFAAGWALIALLSPFTSRGFQWWPLIPSAIFCAVGTGLATGQSTLISFLSYLGPLALILLGVWVVIRRQD